jgi:hypothetical protein
MRFANGSHDYPVASTVPAGETDFGILLDQPEYPLMRLMLPFLLLVTALTARIAGQEPAGQSPAPVRIASKVSGHIHPAVCVGKSGAIVVVFSQTNFKDLRLSRSPDGGRTGTDPVLFPYTGIL